MTDFSQEPIYPTHIKSMAAAYDQAGTTAAYDRRAALATAMMVSGRSSEIKYIHLDVMKWDEHYDCLMVDVQQVKVGEHKVAALVAGTSPHQCFYDAIGAKLAMSRAEPVPADAVIEK